MEAYQDVLADSASQPSALLSDTLFITSISATAGRPAGLSRARVQKVPASSVRYE